ncbi:uncharacterized protein LOC126848032 [Adelges cooleyi]|uniref:uncharacterized protein LOC126848032 n=1 Tax=Adelges cooleyi TaxID=133065 RepID=UPI00217F2BE8|nr:uncharacterized protein LOC126848032 [Adelges cooleyi]
MTLESSELPNEDEVYVQDNGDGTLNYFNNSGNRGTRFNNQGHRGEQVYNQGNRGEQVYTLNTEVQYNQGNIGDAFYYLKDGSSVKFIGDSVLINDELVPRYKKKDVTKIEFGGGSVKINGKIIEQFNGTLGEGIMYF